ncbi:MAG: hypothetical protein J6Y37_00110 [Paludibacteraceae bacterium]|nr:hypothetical protein [Paludibacteraceae bacterium]
MDVSELRIGDWIRQVDDESDATSVVQVLGIDINDNIWARGLLGEDLKPIDAIGCCAVECFEPIPLTPEILEKNGFVIKNGFAQIGNFGNSPLIIWHFKDDPILRHFTHELEIHQNDTGKVHVHIQCDFVHELQHVLSVCGIEKVREL